MYRNIKYIIYEYIKYISIAVSASVQVVAWSASEPFSFSDLLLVKSETNMKTSYDSKWLSLKVSILIMHY